MLVDRVSGMSMEEIAAKYRCSRDTVERRMALAKREKLLDNAAEKVIDNLLGRSIEAYEYLLTQRDDKKVLREAAKDIAFGTGTLSTGNKAVVNPSETKDMTLRMWREKRFASTGEHGAAPRRTRGKQAIAPSDVEEISVIELTAHGSAGTTPDDGTLSGVFGLPGEQEPPDLEGDGDDL